VTKIDLQQQQQENQRLQTSVCIVIPAKAGIQSGAKYPIPAYWIPAFAGMTVDIGP